MQPLKSIFKWSKLAFSMLLITLMACGDDGFDEIITVSNIRLIQINSTSDAVLIGNFGGASEDITSYWLCARNSCTQLSDLTSSGSFNLGNNQFITIDFTLSDISSDVALFSSDNFSSTNALVDFMQYGADVGDDGSVNLAVSKGIWEDGAFVANTAPYTYTSDGTENGVATWRGVIGQSNDAPNIRILQVDPDARTITIKNFGSTPQNVSNFLICNEKSYAVIATLTDEQDLTLDPNETLLLERALSTNASDVAIYSSDAFESTNAMLDFMQYGANIGNAGQIGVAVTKGIWTNGTFVGGAAPFDYTGDGTEIGAGAWMGN